MTAAGIAPRSRRSAPSAQSVLQRAKRATKGVKIGRPLSYSPELCEQAVALGMEGKHPAAIARRFGVDKATLVKWAAQYPAFSNALARAKTFSQAWWEDDVQKNRKAKHYQANPVRMIMAGQFRDDYAEKAGSGLADALPDFLAAITEAADRRRQKALEARDGSQAKAVEPQDVVLEPSDKVR